MTSAAGDSPTARPVDAAPMSWGAGLNIRGRLLLLLAVLAAPFLIHLALSTWRQADQEREQAAQRMLGVARLTAARLDDHIANIQQLLSVLSATVGTRIEDRQRNLALLQELKTKLPPQINNVSVWTPEGESIGTLEPWVRSTRIDPTQRSFFRDALNGATLAIEAPMVSVLNGELVGLLAVGVERDSKAAGVVLASVRLKSLQSLLAPQDSLPSGAVVTVTDAGGVVLARSLQPEKWIGRNLLDTREGGLKDSLERRTGVRNGPSADGIDRIAGFTMAERVPWLVYVGVPADVALAPVKARLLGNVELGCGMLLVGLLLALRVANGIASPLRQLGEDAAAFERGDIHRRSAITQGGEIGLLASTLNRTADALLHRSAALQTSEERLNLALEGSNLALFDWNIALDRIYHGPQAAAMRGFPANEITTDSTTLRQDVHPDDRESMVLRLRAAVIGEVDVYDAEFRTSTQAGGWLWLRAKGRVVQRDAGGRALRLAGTYVDITQRKAFEERLRHLAEVDALTGLPNRTFFLDRLNQAIMRSIRTSKPMALLFLDIDHFKTVNDTLGHAAGDELLTAFARTLQSSVRTSDTVARLGGDEFTVILEGLGGLDDAKAVAQTLVTKARGIETAGGRIAAVSTSIGIAMLTEPRTDAATLLRRADCALYEAKRSGRNRYAAEH
jgi:diguanylate cyclase (GGDEF)-like protein/PAS domain S-box-containing protein